MNPSTALFLINDDMRAIRCQYEPEGTTRILKTMDQTIQVDDIVVVETSTRHYFTCVKVTEVDVLFDYKSNSEMDWIIDKVDVKKFEHLKDQEKTAVQTIQKVQRNREREQLQKDLMEGQEEAFQALELTKMESEQPSPNPNAAYVDPKEFTDDDIQF